VSAFQRRVELLEKWDKSIESLDDLAEVILDVWQEAELFTEEYIVTLIRDRVSRAKEYAKTGQITAMQRAVSYEDLEAISEAIIYGIEKESK
jgi:hypothetical protein